MSSNQVLVVGASSSGWPDLLLVRVKVSKEVAADGWVWPEEKSMLLCFDVKHIFFDVAMIEKTTDDQLG